MDEPALTEEARPAPAAPSASDPVATSPRWHTLAGAGVVVTFVLFAAWRASLGISFLDDAYNAVMTLRLAQGARVFADEMTTQALGFLLAVPFARLWTALFGMAGFVLALRLFYVAVAAAVGYVIYRALRPSFGAGVAALAAWLPLLAPPYNIFGVSYNTMPILAFSAAAALSLAGRRHTRRRPDQGGGGRSGYRRRRGLVPTARLRCSRLRGHAGARSAQQADHPVVPCRRRRSGPSHRRLAAAHCLAT
jgi:hypothetical protein